MITPDIEISAAFYRGLAALIHDAGLNSVTVVSKETGELIKTLVRRSPPINRKKTERSMSDRVYSRFHAASHIEDKLEPGSSGIAWGRHNRNFLVAYKNHRYIGNAPIAEIKKLYYTLSKKGEQKLPFLKPRRRQMVLLRQGVTVQQKLLDDLVKKLKSNIGRLKAAWLVSTVKGPIKITGANKPPAFVTKHIQGARGSFVDGLATPKFPAFTIINRAKGISHKAVNGIIRDALQIRAKAMQANALLFMNGKKNIADYK